MGAAARTTTALYCACAALMAAARPTAPRARAHGPTPLAARSLNLEGGARGEADRDAVETENRERLSVSGVTERFFRRLLAPPPRARLVVADGLHGDARGERDEPKGAAASETLKKTQVRGLQQPPQPRERLPQAV